MIRSALCGGAAQVHQAVALRAGRGRGGQRPLDGQALRAAPGGRARGARGSRALRGAAGRRIAATERGYPTETLPAVSTGLGPSPPDTRLRRHGSERPDSCGPARAQADPGHRRHESPKICFEPDAFEPVRGSGPGSSLRARCARSAAHQCARRTPEPGGPSPSETSRSARRRGRSQRRSQRPGAPGTTYP